MMRATKQKRALRIIGVALVLFFCGMFSYSCVTHRGLMREIAAEDRDPLTGVIRGTEARTLPPAPGHPERARIACLMVHGFCSSHQDFGGLGEELAGMGFTVRQLRLPGHGTTPPDFAYQPPDALLNATRREFVQLKKEFDRVYVVGFSMGGALSTLLAAEQPVDRLVLVSPYYAVNYRWYYILPAETWNFAFGWMVPYVKKSKGYVRLNQRENLGKFFYYTTTPNAGVRRLVLLGKRARRPETLRRVTCPVLLMHSERDEAASTKASREAFELLGATEKQAVWLERSNHVVFWDYDRDEAAARVRDFLSPAP